MNAKPNAISESAQKGKVLIIEKLLLPYIWLKF